MPASAGKVGLTDAGGALGGAIVGLRAREAASLAAPGDPRTPLQPLSPEPREQTEMEVPQVPFERSSSDQTRRQPRSEPLSASPQAVVQAPRGLGVVNREISEPFGSLPQTDWDASEAGRDTAARASNASSGTSVPAATSLLSAEAPRSVSPSQASSNFLWKMRLGITPTGSADDRNMRYLHIHEKGRDHFQKFAKSLIDQLSVECAESNPYVKALCAHRQEMMESTLDLKKEVVDSLAARLGTERVDNLATMTVSEDHGGPCALDCHGNRPCEAHQRFDSQLYLPELEARHQRHLRGNTRFLPGPPSPTASTDRSTTAGSARSDPEARRVAFAGQEERRPSTLRLRVGRNRLELSEDDRSEFLNAIGEHREQSGHPAVSMGHVPVRTCGGDKAPLTARVDLD